VPGSLRTTAMSASSVSLAWNAATDNVKVVRYDVYRSIGTATLTKIGSTTMATTFVDPNVTEKTDYRYRVRAYDAAGNYSSSSILSVTTPSASSIRVWSAFGSYAKGEIVTHLGNTYRCVQDYKGEGDPNWIYAPSLWVRL
jgi:chitin-binding protein